MEMAHSRRHADNPGSALSHGAIDGQGGAMAILEPTREAQEAASGLLLTISPRRVARLLMAIITLLAIVSLAEQYVIHILGRADLEEFLIAVDVDAESNIPTWYQVVVLLGSGLLLGLNAARVRRAGGRFVGHWRGLAVLFVAMSIDELAQLHEHLGRL